MGNNPGRNSVARVFGALLLSAVITDQATGQQSSTTDEWSDEQWETGWGEEAATSNWRGFVEFAAANRIDSGDIPHQDQVLSELRLRTEGDWETDGYAITLKADGWRDEVLERTDHKVREVTLSFGIGDHTDLKIGRQVLTWGVGDLLFINDRFPKDFSYFAGRDDEYLKAPSDAIRLSHFGDRINLDLALITDFAPDEYFSGERFSFFLPQAGEVGLPQEPVTAVEPDGSDNAEVAIRLYQQHGAIEWAVYGFDGHYRQPSGLTPDGALTYAPLQTLGASIRQPLMKGIGFAEAAWYRSPDDRSGLDPVVPNDQIRLLLGYEQELVTNLTGNFQYYLEHTLDHNNLLAASPSPEFEPEENRHLLSTRLSLRTRQDNLVWSIFTFYSPSDRDYHVRPAVSYRASDRWQLSAGANLFGGDQPHTFFAQLEENSSIYLRLRFNY